MKNQHSNKWENRIDFGPPRVQCRKKRIIVQLKSKRCSAAPRLAAAKWLKNPWLKHLSRAAGENPGFKYAAAKRRKNRKNKDHGVSRGKA